MANQKPTKIVSKKHLARIERERRQTRVITLIASLILVAVFGLIVYGVLDQTVLVNYRTIATVNGEKITAGEFRTRVKAQRQQMVDTYVQYYQLYVMFGMDPTQDSSLNSLLTQLNDSATVGQDVLNTMEENILVRQYAQANGITVTEEEINQAIQEAFEYYPNGTPTAAPSSTPIVYSTLSPEQLALMTPTYTLDPGPTSTRAPTLTPDLSATATLVPSLTPTATPYTEEGFQARYQEALDYYGSTGITDSDYRRFYFEDSLYRTKVMDLVLTDVPYESEQVWARHILVADQATAQSLYDQLMAGADFFTLAAANSIDTSSASQGGDLGWFGIGEMVSEFETAAFSLKIGEISEPVQTTNGWHIIQVLGHEMRPLTESEYDDARNTAFDAWLQEQRNGAVIEVKDGWMNYIPDSPTVTDGFNNLYATQTAYAPTAEAAAATETPTP